MEVDREPVAPTLPAGSSSTGAASTQSGLAGGHELNAAVALALRVDDPALLHYRLVASYLARAAQVEVDGLRDIMLGVVAAAVEPIAGGRQEVFGRREPGDPPDDLDDFSHVPRAVGTALAIDCVVPLGVTSSCLSVLCSSGDAAVNHGTADFVC